MNPGRWDIVAIMTGLGLLLLAVAGVWMLVL